MRPAHEREEGVTSFHAEHRWRPLSRAAQERAPGLLAWRTIMFRMNGIGREAERYDGAGFGNLSLRLPPYPGAPGARAHLITGTQTGGERRLTAEGLAEVQCYDHSTNRVRSAGPSAPSSESMTHGAIYDLDARIRAVFHVHCPEIFRRADVLRLPATSAGIGYGTPAMAREMSRLRRVSNLLDARCLVMTGHEDGVIAFGVSAEAAGQRLLSVLATALQSVR